MRRHAPLIAVLVVGVCASATHAGVYSPFSVELNFKIDDKYFSVFNNSSLIPLRQVGTPNGLQDWQQFYALTGAGLDLAKLGPTRDPKSTGPLTVEQRLILGTALLRLRRPTEAIEVLRPATKQDPQNFLVMSTLGTAYMLAGDNQAAGDWLGAAASSWRKKYADLAPTTRKGDETWGKYLSDNFKWTEHEFGWYANCEKYHKYLALLRAREGLKGSLTFDKALMQLDPLFPLFDFNNPKPTDFVPLRFVGESGKFEPGKIAAAEKAKLPKDAILIVQQLLIWMPDDARLYWLLGELLNAQGDVDSAKTVLTDFLSKYIYQQETGIWPTAGKVDDSKIDPKDREKKFEKWLPKFIETYPEVGSRLKALREYTPPLRNDAVVPPSFESKDQQPSKLPTSSDADKPAVAELKVDWLQALGVGFGAGILVGLIVARGWREMRRRRQARNLRPGQEVKDRGHTGIHSH
jgi:tetratricopeptide (TPR) repeat protein